MRNPSFTVYKASAGSGKTFTLTVEFISLLLSSPNPALHRHVLAVTFTNKATLEMKNRILEQLYGLAYEIPGSETYEKYIAANTGLSHEAICQRSRSVLSHILHDYDHFRVETIDSFFQSILSNLAHELNLPAGLQVDINDREVIETAVDLFITDLQPNTQILNWTLNYIRERISENQRWDIRREVKNFAMNLVNEHYLMSEEKLTAILSDNQATEAYKALLLEMKEDAVDIVRSAAVHLLELLEQHGLGEKSFSNGRFLYAYLNGLLNGQFKEPNATLNKYLNGAENWIRKTDSKNTSLISIIREELLPVLTLTETYRVRQQTVYNSCVLTLQYLNPLRLLNTVNNVATQINQEQSRFMLAKTPILLNRFVGDDDASFIFEKAGNQFHHIMIDEFQDTSLLQWRNFKKLLLENLSSGNRCLLVGDIKQSIYRWRNGDWSILHDIRKEFPHTDIAVEQLTVNRRSEAGIIQFNNRFFAQAADLLEKNATPDDSAGITAVYSDVAQESPEEKAPEGGYVDVRILTDKKESPDEADWETTMLDEMATEIVRMHEEFGVPYASMAILIRYNMDSKQIVSHFSTAYPSIPLISSEAFLLSSSRAVNTVIHALRYLYDETDRIAMAFLARQNDDTAGPSDTRTLYEHPETLLPAPFTEQAALLRTQPLYETIERIVRIYKLTEKSGQIAYIQTFLDESLNFLSDHISDIGEFLTYWDETLKNKAIPVSDQIDGIRILTIHKAKGLQYHTLFMPYVNWKIESDRLGDILWCVPPQSPYDTLPVVPVSTTSVTSQSVYAGAHHEEHFQRRVENLNLLYVGFTRAEKNLFIWGTGKPDSLDKKTATVGDLTAAVLATFGESGCETELSYRRGTPCGIDAQKKKNRTDRMHLPSSVVTLAAHATNDFVRFQQSNQSYEFTRQLDDTSDKHAEDYILRGNILHKVFSAIATEQDIEPTLDALQQQGLLPDTIRRKEIASLLRRGLENPEVADWFSDKWTLFRECNILTRDQQGNAVTKRPDRVMINGDKAVVVDFKFGKPNEAYRSQVLEYVQILEQMGYPHPKGYVWYVYQNHIVQIDNH